MKKTAETAEKLGAEVERYFCSSDPDSLDAVRIRPAGSTRLVALCDCTEPHPRAESSPGIVSRTVDLGRFRNDRKLASHRDEILRLQEQKASAYSAAYLYLSAAGKVRQARTGILTETCDLEAMHAAAKRSLLGITGEGSSEIRRPLSAVSMKGSAVIAADENCCSRCFITEDIYGSAYRGSTEQRAFASSCAGLWRAATRHIGQHTGSGTHRDRIRRCGRASRDPDRTFHRQRGTCTAPQGAPGSRKRGRGALQTRL